jgi:hypothetical protein
MLFIIFFVFSLYYAADEMQERMSNCHCCAEQWISIKQISKTQMHVIYVNGMHGHSTC